MLREPSPDVPMLDMHNVFRTAPSASASASRGPSNAIHRSDSANGFSANSSNVAQSKETPDRSSLRSQHRTRESADIAAPTPTSQSRASASATANGTAAAHASAGGSQPSLPRPTPSAAKAVSLTRHASATTGTRSSLASGTVAGISGGGAAGAIKASVMTSTMPEGQFSGYSGDVAKYLKELIRRRDENVYLRVLPKHQQLHQLVLQETTARGLATQQEQSARQSIVHKAHEERAKKREQEIARDSKEKLDEQKRLQQEELATQKLLVTTLQAETDKDLRDRLRIIQALHPKLNPINAALAELKNERSDCTMLAALLEEDKKVQKALKGNARHAKSKTAETDGGALPFWLKDCTAASFNVAAILAGSPLRACVTDAPSIASRVAADKKIVVVRATAATDAPIVAWAHTRVAKPDTAAAVAALLPLLGVDADDSTGRNAALEVAPLAECGPTAQFAQVVWPKEDCAAVAKLAKGPKTECGCLQSLTVCSLAQDGIASHEFTVKDIIALGEAVS